MGTQVSGCHHLPHRSTALHGAAPLNPAIAQIARREYGRAVAVLTRFLGDLSLAEEAVQEAFAIATEQWPRKGIPPAPGGWLITTARHRALDRLRRESSRPDREAAAITLAAASDEEEPEVRDDTLRLMFTCCHPALAPEAQVVLTLRLLGGLSTAQIARALLLTQTTVAQRVSRVKAKIREAGIPYRIPAVEELPERTRAVLAVVYLIFNEGYLSTGSEDLIRLDLCEEAIRLGTLLVELLPEDPEVRGLLALMLFTHARRAARTDSSGALVDLPHQDRSLWDAQQIAAAQSLLRGCLREDKPGPYQLQAAINAVHCEAPDSAATDWSQILTLYDHLFALQPVAVVALNRAVALAEVAGPHRALEEVDALVGLHRYHLYHAVRAHLLVRLHREADAALAYRAAIDNATHPKEREHLQKHYAALSRQ